MLDIDELIEESASIGKPTPPQRRALYRLGRSKAWVAKHVQDRAQADAIIRRSLEDMSVLKSGSRKVSLEPESVC